MAMDAGNMIVRIDAEKFDPDTTAAEVGLKSTLRHALNIRSKFGRVIYNVIDEHTFFLACIEHGIEFEEVYDDIYNEHRIIS